MLHQLIEDNNLVVHATVIASWGVAFKTVDYDHWSDLHALGAGLLAGASLYEWIPESVVVAWTVPRPML